ncbi:MAG: helix-turn-helix transcriptional regulator [Dehalococcoidia bacterium]|nr:helix-turn-helix transcriptional regulator [Dehalococcoidia bacterium]
MKNEVVVRFGQRVRAQRLKMGLSQEALAERAGVHRTYIGMIERAEKNVTIATVDKICKALGISMSQCLEDP